MENTYENICGVFFYRLVPEQYSFNTVGKSFKYIRIYCTCF